MCFNNSSCYSLCKAFSFLSSSIFLLACCKTTGIESVRRNVDINVKRKEGVIITILYHIYCIFKHLSFPDPTWLPLIALPQMAPFPLAGIGTMGGHLHQIINSLFLERDGPLAFLQVPVGGTERCAERPVGGGDPPG